MAFVANSFEHSIANMYFIPLGMFYGANVTTGQFFANNLLLSVLGNYVGGGFFMGFLAYYLYLRAAPVPPPKKAT